jgi:hypothetical protein
MCITFIYSNTPHSHKVNTQLAEERSSKRNTSYEPARAHGVRDESSRPSHHLIGDLKFSCWDLKFGRYRPYLYLS